MDDLRCVDESLEGARIDMVGPRVKEFIVFFRRVKSQPAGSDSGTCHALRLSGTPAMFCEQLSYHMPCCAESCCDVHPRPGTCCAQAVLSLAVMYTLPLHRAPLPDVMPVRM